MSKRLATLLMQYQQAVARGDELSLLAAHCHNLHHTFEWENKVVEKLRHPTWWSGKFLKHGFQAHCRLSVTSTCMLPIEDYTIVHSPHLWVWRPKPIHKPRSDMEHVTPNLWPKHPIWNQLHPSIPLSVLNLVQTSHWLVPHAAQSWHTAIRVGHKCSWHLYMCGVQKNKHFTSEDGR